MEKDQIRLAEDFKSIAERFCTLVDSLSRTERDDLLSRLYLLLPELITGAASLPAVSFEDDPLAEADNHTPRSSVRMSHAQWQHLYESLKIKLAPSDIYWIVTKCWKSGESLQESLADDIADIYRDLKCGIGENNLRDMVFEWRLSFYSHWGNHAIGALGAIHELMVDVRS